MESGSGTNGRSSEAATGQWAKSNWRQRWYPVASLTSFVCGSWPQYDPHTTLLFVLELFVRPGRVLERQPMRDNTGGVHFTALDVLQQALRVAHRVHLSCFDGQSLVHHRAERQLVSEPRVHTHDRDGA